MKLLLPAGLGLLLLALVAGAADWPQWRGPRRNGISQESGLLKEWPKEGPKLLWRLADIGDGYATPSVVGHGSTYLATAAWTMSSFRLCLSRMAKRSGPHAWEMWEVPTRSRPTQWPAPPPR